MTWCAQSQNHCAFPETNAGLIGTRLVAPANAATIKDALKGKWAPQLCASSLAIFDLSMVG